MGGWADVATRPQREKWLGLTPRRLRRSPHHHDTLRITNPRGPRFLVGGEHGSEAGDEGATVHHSDLRLAGIVAPDVTRGKVGYERLPTT